MPDDGRVQRLSVERLREDAYVARFARRTALNALRRAIFELRRARPGQSAASAAPQTGWAMAGPTLFMLGLIIFAPTVASAMIWGLLGAGFLSLAVFRLSAALTPPRYSPRRPLPVSQLPSLTVICALHREPGEVVEGLARQLSQLDYPADRLTLALAVEADDEETCRAAHAAARRWPLEVIETPPRGPRTKPKALNYALHLTGGELIAVYDAEDCPAPDQLRAAAEAFSADARLGCVQAPLSWYNAEETWLTRQFALEYAAQFHVLLPFYARLGWPLPLGGTSNVFRRTALETCGGWDPFNVTEDADLGFRLAREGWRIGLIEPGTREEAPTTLRPWIAQRSRWLKGHLITSMVHARDLPDLRRGAGPGACRALIIALAANALSGALHAPSLFAALMLAGLSAFVHWGSAPLWGLAVLMAGYAAAGAAALVGARRAGFRPRLSALLSMPLYWPLQSLAFMRALNEMAGDPYSWTKTHHGVSAVPRPDTGPGGA
ncbi:MAG: glycosyltransferase family 2 protein [Pseudomonadota bacterium]